MVLEIIYVHGDGVFVPDHFVVVELGNVQCQTCSVIVLRVVAVLGMGAFVCPVVGAVDDVLVVDRLDDVYFAAGGPVDFAYVRAEHPERGPDSLAYGERDAGLYGAVGEAKLPFGNHTGRGVVGAFVAFLVGADVENPVLHICIFATGGVVLPFVVAPAGGSRFESPFACVDGGSVEFVVPEVRGRT